MMRPLRVRSTAAAKKIGLSANAARDWLINTSTGGKLGGHFRDIVCFAATAFGLNLRRQCISGRLSVPLPQPLQRDGHYSQVECSGSSVAKRQLPNLCNLVQMQVHQAESL